MSKAQYRRNHTAQVGILVPNGHKGRSQKGCFGSPKYNQKKKKKEKENGKDK